MKCLFPEHHKVRSYGALLALAAAVVLVLMFGHVIETIVLAVAYVAAGLLSARLVYAVIRFADLPSAAKRNYPAAVWARIRWRYLVRNLGLSLVDAHAKDSGKRKVRHPRARIRPDAYGFAAHVRTVPGADRKAFEDVAEHIANAHRAARVSVSQPKPGHLIVRSMLRDPLLERLTLEDRPVYGSTSVQDPSRVWLGRAEDGEPRWLDLRNVSGVVVGGVPGGGKSQAITSWETQLAPCPAVQLVNHDGKGAGEFDDLAPRVWITGGESLGELLATLDTLTVLMNERLRMVRDFTYGRKNIWTPGPGRPFGVCPEWPLIFSVFDETQVWFDLGAAKARGKDAEKDAVQAITLAAGLVRKGRAAGMVSVFSTQKPTSDSCPSAVTSNCALSVAFSLRTLDAAKSCLGQDVGNYPSLSPVALSLPEHAGVCVASLKDGLMPFTRLRSPMVTEDQAAAAALASAHLRKDPRTTMPVAVPDDVSALVG